MADKQLLKTVNIGLWFFFGVVDIYSKHAWIFPLKDKGFTITNSFQQILNEPERKQNKTFVYKVCEFYNRSIKSWLKDNTTETYSTHNEGKDVVAE